jgi:Xaa-Pro aminopeptidase
MTVKRKREEGAMTAAERVFDMRAAMSAQGYAAFLVPSEDAHMSEYVAACDERRAFISGFDGSAGMVVVTQDKALCWTDGRYFVQAEAQLDSDVFTLMKMNEDPCFEFWLADNLPDSSVVAVDGKTMSVAVFERLRSVFCTRAKGNVVSLVALPTDASNLVDSVWGDSRPAAPTSSIFVHPLKYAGVSTEEKLAAVRDAMKKENVSHHIVTGLDEVAWLLNLRGSDVEYK